VFVLINLAVDMTYALLNPRCAMAEARFVSGHRIAPCGLPAAGSRSNCCSPSSAGWLRRRIAGQDLMLERLAAILGPGRRPGYWLGTDSLGRDLLSRLIYGGRIAFIVAFAASIAACRGSLIARTGSPAILAAADRIISRIVDIWMASGLFCRHLAGRGSRHRPQLVIIAIAVID